MLPLWRQKEEKYTASEGKSDLQSRSGSARLAVRRRRRKCPRKRRKEKNEGRKERWVHEGMERKRMRM